MYKSVFCNNHDFITYRNYLKQRTGLNGRSLLKISGYVGQKQRITLQRAQKNLKNYCNVAQK